MPKIKRILIFGSGILIAVLLIYTRIVGLDWGLPYPMHPDERNMTNAIQQLHCDWQSVFGNRFSVKECMNPNFFAYGQFPLYLGYGLVFLVKFFAGDLFTPISFEEAALSLRLIASTSSVLNVFVLLALVKLLISKFQFPISKQISNIKYQIAIFLIFIFSPFFIQFSHFGTTESLLMFLFSIIIYLSIKFAQNKIQSFIFLLLTAFFSGLAIATKVSSVLFLIVPLALIIDYFKVNLMQRFLSIYYLLSLTLIFSILFSPHNFISFPQFLGAMKYESDVALGSYRAFYTRQFEGVSPIIFQLLKIFPYSLGWPVFILSLLGFIFLPLKIEFNILRLGILAGFLSNAFFYAKWTRFVSPVLPFMLIFSVLCLISLYRYNDIKLSYKILSNFIFYIICFTVILPGIAFLSIYQRPDVRFTVSEWVYKNIPNNSYVLSETANVVDVPISNPKEKNNRATININYISFNFYDLDENPELLPQLQDHLAKANYIFIPSRRIFANNYCPKDDILPNANRELNFELITIKDEEKCKYLRIKYPLLNDYYDRLFTGQLGFVKVAEFREFPKIQLFGKTLLEFPDEEAEETWTVFDHPVFRIYKKI